MSRIPKPSRRSFAAIAAIGIATAATPVWAAESEEKYAKETGATEDLMREHGVLRRALLVYNHAAGALRDGQAGLDPAALKNTAILFRDFGERYHERLEEEHIFPVVRKTKGEAAGYPDILTAQHARGREITQYIIHVADRGRIGSGDAESLSRSLAAFVLMYRNHAAREDTIVFPAWKTALSARQVDEMGEEFEDIERRMFGKDGFEHAVAEVGQIEQTLGFADLARFTAPPPPGP
jgi:hemerythrin-like domain-containing protein